MAAFPLNQLLPIPLAGLTLIVDNAKSPLDPLSLKTEAVARQQSRSKIPKRAVSFDSGRSRWSTNGYTPDMSSTGPPPPPPVGVGNDVRSPRVLERRGTMSPLVLVSPTDKTSIPIKPIRKASPQVSQRKALSHRSASFDDSSTGFHHLALHKQHNALYTPHAPPALRRPNKRPVRKASPVVSQKKSISPTTFHNGWGKEKISPACTIVPQSSISSPHQQPPRSPAIVSQKKSPSAE